MCDCEGSVTALHRFIIVCKIRFSLPLTFQSGFIYKHFNDVYELRQDCAKFRLTVLQPVVTGTVHRPLM